MDIHVDYKTLTIPSWAIQGVKFSGTKATTRVMIIEYKTVHLVIVTDSVGISMLIRTFLSWIVSQSYPCTKRCRFYWKVPLNNATIFSIYELLGFNTCGSINRSFKALYCWFLAKIALTIRNCN